MKAPKRTTVEYIYAKLKHEVVGFIEGEISFNRNMGAECYGFNAEEEMLYDTFCRNLIEIIENTEINYVKLAKDYNDEEFPF